MVGHHTRVAGAYVGRGSWRVCPYALALEIFADTLDRVKERLAYEVQPVCVSFMVINVGERCDALVVVERAHIHDLEGACDGHKDAQASESSKPAGQAADTVGGA